MDLAECNICKTRGYILVDKKRKLCHLCVQREKSEVARELKEIFDKFMAEDFNNWYKSENWRFCKPGISMIGNSIIQAIQRYEPSWQPFENLETIK